VVKKQKKAKKSLKKDKLFQELYNKSLRFLGYRSRSIQEIKKYLFKKAPRSQSSVKKDKLINKVINKLKQKGLVDDYQFSIWWIEQRLKFRPRGKIGLKKELFQKGVSGKTIERALQTIDEAELRKAALKVVEKKASLYKKMPEIKRRNKLFKHLARRGFSYAFSKTIVDAFFRK